MTIASLCLLFLFGVHSQIISPTNVTGNSALIHFDWEESDLSYTTWILEFWKDNRIVWQKTLDSKPSSMQMSNLDRWTNYTLILKTVRDLYIHNIIYTRHVLQEVYSNFITIPRIISIKRIKKNYKDITVLRASIQIFDMRNYKWSIEWKGIEDKNFNQKTKFLWVSKYQKRLTVTIPSKHKPALARVRIKKEVDLNQKEEYYSPTQLIMI